MRPHPTTPTRTRSAPSLLPCIIWTWSSWNPFRSRCHCPMIKLPGRCMSINAGGAYVDITGVERMISLNPLADDPVSSDRRPGKRVVRFAAAGFNALARLMRRLVRAPLGRFARHRDERHLAEALLHQFTAVVTTDSW